MRLHRLTISAIGPFPGDHAIDFDALAVSGLFLLTGPTGSGKSTLLDAVEFALYGTASGAMKERLPSGHAAPGAHPRVELVFSNQRGIYRVERTPEHRRPKARGEGMTTEKSRATLIRLTSLDDLDAVGEPVSAHVQEIGMLIPEIVGLTREQFTQTVLLPQGKFARFLTSSPEDRRSVLQDVFGTQIYQAAEERLRSAAAAARARTEAAAQEVTAEWRDLWKLAGAAAGRAGIAEPEAGSSGSIEAAVAAVEAASAEEQQALVRSRGARDAATGAARALADGQLRAERLQRWESATAKMAELESTRSAIFRDRARVDAATRAASAVIALRTAQEAAEAESGTRQTFAAALADCRDRGIMLPRTGDLAAIREELGRAQRAAERLTEALSIEKELNRQRTDAAQIESTILGKAGDRTRMEEELASVPARRESLAAQRRHLEPVAADLPAATAGQEAARTRVDAAQALLAAEAESGRTEAQRTASAEQAARAQRHVAELHREWISSIAGEVAEELSAGDPCPVCGSPHHPDPAIRPEGAPSRTDVADARTSSERADAVAATAAAKAEAAAARVAALRSQLGAHDPRESAMEFEKAQGRVQRARDAATEISELQRSIELVDQEAETARAALTELSREVSELSSRKAVLDAAMANSSGLVDAARGQHPTVATAVASANGQVLALKAAEVAGREAEAAGRRHEDAARHLGETLVRLGFRDAHAARASAMDSEEVETLAAKVAAHDESVIATRAILGEPELAEGGVAPDLPTLESAAEAAERIAVAAEQGAGEAHMIADRARDALGLLRQALAVYTDAVAAAAPLFAMADAASGRNPRSTSLSSYVLLRRFEEVLEAANRRLSVMSEDRYQLVRSEEREAGQRAQRLGLAVAVVDHELGTTRSPHTLSGGETFYTSLALALGLADTVTDEAGGIELGTLFVDEGFGTLDPDALENVMSVLHGLSSGGRRAVGIVSHVQDLRSRISEQVVVRRRAEGGSTLTVEA